MASVSVESTETPGTLLTRYRAANATSHLFFAYLRSLTPDSVHGTNGISALPLSLQKLLETTDYPPILHGVLESQTTKVVMIVDTVSPTPFALLRRAKHFQYRDDDQALQRFSEYDDPVQALTDECRRVLKNISSANDSSTTKASTSLRDPSWSRFEDIGFGGLGDESDHDDEADGSAFGRKRRQPQGLRATPHSRTDLGRPTTPSWADFLSSGFVDDPSKSTSGLLLPPDKILPPINTRGQSSQSHKPMIDHNSMLEPGELASIMTFNLDDAFWWVWISSLAGEEPLDRKAAFGRCALVETNIRGGKWLVMEEIIKGAAPEPAEGAYIAEKKSRFGFSKRTRVNRAKSTSGKKTLTQEKADLRSNQPTPSIRSIAPDQHARIQAAAAALQQKHMQESAPGSPRRGRHDEDVKAKTNSVFTLQPVIMSEAMPAMKWANSYDKNAIRAKYLGDNFAGKGSTSNLDLSIQSPSLKVESTNHSTPMVTAQSQAPIPPRNDSYGFPPEKNASMRDLSRQVQSDRNLPPPPRYQSDELLYEPPTHREPTPAHSPAPLPAAPVVDVRAANQRTVDAAEVPLPSPTPAEYPRAMQRKPLPPPKQSEKHVSSGRPDSFSPGPEYSKHPLHAEEATPIERVVSPETSPDSKRNGGKKLKKAKGPGAFKNMFGRKKTEVPAPTAPTAPRTNSTSAVAAARAALEARQNAVHSEAPVAPPETKASRRLSDINRKAPPGTNLAAPTRGAPSMPQMVEEHGEHTAEFTPVPSPRFPTDQYQGSQVSLNRVDTNEQRQAEHEFRTFDQGPLQDVPAFVPKHSPVMSSSFNPSREHIPQEHPHPTKAHEIAARVFAAPLTTPSAERVVPDDDSDESNELTQQISPVQDRWAQIRKDAAQRAAMQQSSSRPSEEQSRKTDRTDDGETSGEES